MQVAGAVNRAHAAHANHVLDQVTIGEGRPELQLPVRPTITGL
jgi:hypothetical protein